MNAKRLIHIAVVTCIVLCCATESFAVYTSARQLLNKPPDWYKSDEAAKAAAAVLSYQALTWITVPLGKAAWATRIVSAGIGAMGDTWRDIAHLLEHHGKSTQTITGHDL